MLDHKTMFVMTCYDFVFKIHFEPLRIEILSQSGLLVNGFSMFYYPEQDDFVYILGGRSTESNDKVSTCRKYNIKNDQWEYIPGMKEPRDKPGVLLSQDKSTLYAFGGGCTTIEKLDLNDINATWHLIYLEIPSQIKNDC